MGSRGAGAVLAASLVVGGYAAFRALVGRQGGEQDPQWIYAPAVSDGSAKTKLAAFIETGEPQDARQGLISWGVDTLFDALGGKQATSIHVARSAGTTAPSANDDHAPGFWGSLGGAVNRGAGGLLDFIAQFEAPGGYNQVYGGSKVEPPRPITTMTVREVLAWQDRSVAAGSPSSAAGRYQVIQGTLREQVRAGVVGMDEPFSPKVQDRIGTALLEKRGLSDYQAGRISAAKFGDNLAKEWASLPAQLRDKRGRSAQGQSYYAGDGLNRAHTSQKSVLDKLGDLI